MNRKIVIGVVVSGAVVIIAIFALSLMRSQIDTGTPYNLMGDAAYEKSAPLRAGSGMALGIPAPEESTMQSSDGGEISTDKKVIKNGDMTLKVGDAEKAAEDIAQIAATNKGEIFSTNFYQTADNVKSGTITVKVPVSNFEKTFSEMKKVASLVVSESSSGQDVTEQYTDLQSRLKNKQAEEQAFAKILERSGEIDDVLKVTRELARVRGEIEVLQGRIKLLESQTDMATITATISEDPKITITDKWRPFQVVKETLNSLLKDIQKFVNFVIVLIIRVIPVILLYAIIVWIIYLLGRKIYRKIKVKKDETQ
jgi:hypothetical protein